MRPLPAQRLFGGGDTVGLIDARGDLWLSEPEREAGALQHRREVNLGAALSACLGDFGCWRIDLAGCIHHVKQAPTALRQALGFQTGQSDWSVQPPPGRRYLRMSAGQRHLVAIDDLGQLWGWGGHEHGQLGTGAMHRVQPPPRDQGSHAAPVLMAQEVLEVAALPFCTLVVDTQGALKVVGEWPEAPSQERAKHDYTTTMVERLRWVHHAQDTTLVLDDEGIVQGVGTIRTLVSRGGEKAWEYELVDGWCWVAGSVDSRAATGGRHTAHVDQEGQLFTRGCNAWGQLGTGDTAPHNGLTPVAQGYVEVACGPRFTAALRADGGVDFMGLMALQNPDYPADPALALRPARILKNAAQRA
jgi:alpha-tubulin suppressor-like RCC1 family protein